MSVQELQKYTAVSKYARWLEKEKRREVWSETVGRYADMMCEKYPHRAPRVWEIAASIEAFEVMPSMRALQFGGPPIFKHQARGYNCSASYCDRLRFFAEFFYLLLCGSGVGFSVQEHHLRNLPNFSKKRLSGAKLAKRKFVVPDTIEGWADTTNVLLSAFHEEPVKGFEDYHECEPIFDYSPIRDRGSPLSFGIGTAPGPLPLRNANKRNKALLERALSEGLTRLNSIYAYDYAMNDADASVSGGVRRSATLCLFDIFDTLMLNAKVGDWRQANPQRGRSNNTAVCLRGELTWEQFRSLFEYTKQFGEPGIGLTDNKDIVFNPCFEIGLVGKLFVRDDSPDLTRLLANYQGPIGRERNGVWLSGFQGCNLSSISCKSVRDRDDFLRRCREAAELGTWQAGFDRFPYLGEVTERIVQKEALLGVSLCGVMHQPELMLDPELLEEGARAVIRANEREAALIGINPAARTTCVKPDGNLGSLLGSFSGCHPGKFREGFRIVQVNKGEKPYQHFSRVNPEACEASVWSPNGTDDVIRFCVNYDGLIEDEFAAVEFLSKVRLLQKHWVNAGTVSSRCAIPGITHSTSNTVRVDNHEWDEVAQYIFDYQEDFAGVSFIGAFGDRDYPQAPFTSVHGPEDIQKMYGVAHDDIMVCALLEGAEAFPNLWDASDALLGRWDETKTLTEKQAEWVAATARFADDAMGGDLRKTSYLLKDCFNLSLYRRLKAAYRPVDYAKMVEETSGVQLSGEQACASGACEL